MPQKLRSEIAKPETPRKTDTEAVTQPRRSRSRTARSLGFFLWERRWFIFAILLGAFLLTLPTPDGLTREGWITIVMSVVSIVLFVTEPVPLPTVALMIIAGQVLLLGIDSTTVAKSLMNDSVLFIMGSLMLAVAIVKQKLDKRIAYLIVRMTGTKTINVSFGISLVSGVLASVMGEHTVAAMMLPVALTLITLTSEDPREVRKLAAVLLFSICYGCSIAGIGTPSGGARNAIMVDYWRQFFHDPADPATDIYLVDYAMWIAYCYPIFLIQLPFVTAILYFTFRPRKTNLSRAVVKLRRQIEKDGSMKLADWLAILVFLAVLLAWITLSDVYGLGIIALIGVVVFLVIGLVRWEDINSGVNWGVVLLYAAAISLGVQMKDSGAALWIANGFLGILSPLGVDSGPGLWAAVSMLTAGVTNTMSNGAAVAVLGPITLNMADAAGESPLVIGFVTAISSAFAYLTVIGTPACTIVYSSGYLKSTEFLTVGVRMLLVSTVVLVLAAWLYWPLLPQ